MHTLGPFFSLENESWFFVLIDAESIQIYSPQSKTYVNVDDCDPFWVYAPETGGYRLFSIRNKVFNQIVATPRLINHETLLTFGPLESFNPETNHFTVESAINRAQKLAFDEFLKPYLSWDNEELDRIAATLSVEEKPADLPQLSLDKMNISIGDYPQLEVRATLIEVLREAWPFKAEFSTQLQIEIARRILGGDRVSLEALAEHDDPAELFRDVWIQPNPETNPELGWIDNEAQKIYARHFIGLLVAQVLVSLNAIEFIPNEFTNPIPRVLTEVYQVRQEANRQREIDENEAYAIQLQNEDNFVDDAALALQLQEQEFQDHVGGPQEHVLPAPRANFVMLDVTTHAHFLNLITQLPHNVQDNFRQCIYHDVGENIVWQYLVYVCRVIGFYLNMGRFYQLNEALNQLQQADIHRLHQGLLGQAELNNPNEAITRYMFSC